MRKTLSHLPRLAARLFVAMILLAASGCTGFNRAWKEASTDQNPTHSLEGRWLGTWTSEESGHTGRLRCIITHTENDTYEARFHANYRKILSFAYTVPLTVDIRAGVAKFKGTVDLGWYAGGVYVYEGDANGARFHSTYKATQDHGAFEMLRPPVGQ